MDTFKELVKGAIGWFLVVWGTLTLNDVAVVLAIVYSVLQISAFFYPWHKKLWKKLGASEDAINND